MNRNRSVSSGTPRSSSTATFFLATIVVSAMSLASLLFVISSDSRFGSVHFRQSSYSADMPQLRNVISNDLQEVSSLRDEVGELLAEIGSLQHSIFDANKFVAKDSEQRGTNQDQSYTDLKEPYPVDFIPPINTSVIDFERQDGVVIVTKIHSEKAKNHIKMLKQSLCLLQKAYNDRLQYDILVFTSLPVSESVQQDIKAMVSPTRLTFVVDNDGIPSMLKSLKPEALQRFFDRCHVSSIEDVTFETICKDGDKIEKIAYNWQAEFRALHIWNHPAMIPYKYMFWIDTDAFFLGKLKEDPVAKAVREDMAIFYANFPMGFARGEAWNQRIADAFNQTACRILFNNAGGHIYAKEGTCKSPQLAQIHGFMHITKLEFFRSEPVMNWFQIMIGNEKFSRKYDDQIAVTVPSAILAPHRSLRMWDRGVYLNVYHNTYRYIPDQRKCDINFVKFWSLHGNTSFPEAFGVCDVLVAT